MYLCINELDPDNSLERKRGEKTKLLVAILKHQFPTNSNISCWTTVSTPSCDTKVISFFLYTSMEYLHTLKCKGKITH